MFVSVSSINDGGMLFDHSKSKKFLGMFMLQPQYSYNTMPNKWKKKAKVTGEDSHMEFLPRMEIIYEDTKSDLNWNLSGDKFIKWSKTRPFQMQD